MNAPPHRTDSPSDGGSRARGSSSGGPGVRGSNGGNGSPPPEPIAEPGRVAALTAELRAAGRFFLDLEFVSEDRYLPEPGLVQVAWGDPRAPQVAAVDPLAADVRPLAELVADPEVTVVLHSAQADLALLAERFGVVARSVYDTQVAAAFAGLGDQVGYAGLAERLLGVAIDKGSQFTDWLRRPLSERQLRYALDDVRHLPALWAELERRLQESGRLAWVAEESRRLAEQAAARADPETLYRKVPGWERLKPRSLGALRALAAWRERQARASNTPPRWLLAERVMLEVARRLPRSRRDLEAARGLKESAVRRHGDAVLEAVRAGAEEPLAPPRPPPPLPERAQAWVPLVSGLVQARCREAGIAPRFVLTKSAAEELVRWWLRRAKAGEEGSAEPALPLLAGWRRELAGAAALDWLAGRAALAADADSSSGLRVVELE